MLRRSVSVLMKPTRIEILSKPDCCLCDQALFQVNRLIDNIKLLNPDKKFVVEKIDISRNPDLNDEFSLSIPVIRLNGNEIVSESIIDIPKLRNKLLYCDDTKSL